MGITKSLFITFAFTLLVCGCNTTNLLYRNADTYLQHKINGYTSFGSEQKDTIQREVIEYLRWHQRNALPEYIIFLQRLNKAVQIDDQLKIEEVALLRVELQGLYKKTMAPTIRPSSRLLADLNDQQIQDLDKTFAEKIQDQKHELLDGSTEEILGKRAEKTIDFLEDLTGSLSTEQELKITELSHQLPMVGDVFITTRERNQRELLKLLNNHAGAEQIAAFLTSWMLTPEVNRSLSQQQSVQSFEAAVDYMITQIHSLLTARQKLHLQKKILSYIEDMQIIIAE